MKVAVIVGGPSTEAHVSRVSGAATAKALSTAGHDVTTLELDRFVAARLLELNPDVVFPLAHGELGEDGSLQGLLEVLGIPYVGSGVAAAGVASDKVRSKVFFRAAGLPLARELLLHESEAADADLETIRDELGAAFVVKPPNGGSTIGISRVMPADGETVFREALRVGFELESTLLLESYVEGAELTCGVLEGDEGPVALPPTLILSEASDWYDFRSKYQAGGSRHLCPAPLSEEALKRIQRAAVTAHRAVGARDLSRTDFIVSESGEFVVLELNNLPGMTGVSLFPEAAQAAGIAFPELVDRLVRRAFSRGAVRRVKGQELPA